jgi:hypothetical protein
MGARNRVGIGLSYWPARLHRLAELIPGLLKSLKIRAHKADPPPPPNAVFYVCPDLNGGMLLVRRLVPLIHWPSL